MSNQVIFNPSNFCFEWTADCEWYEWDHEEAHKQALKARNAEAKAIKGLGFQVKKWTLKDQLITRGGIGSGYPEISMVVNCYAFNYS